MYLLIEAKTGERKEVTTFEEWEALLATSRYRLPTPQEQNSHVREKRQATMLTESKEKE